VPEGIVGDDEQTEPRLCDAQAASAGAAPAASCATCCARAGPIAARVTLAALAKRARRIAARRTMRQVYGGAAAQRAGIAPASDGLEPARASTFAPVITVAG
jgi:hypothetical protein